MTGLVEENFEKWTGGKNAVQARIAVYERIRDIPYAGLPDLVDAERYVEILSVGRGSCTPKHFLLGSMYQKLGLQVLYVVYPFRWDEIEIDYPRRLLSLARQLPTSHHLACLVDIDDQLTLVDATIDPALRTLGLPVNEYWDGSSDTLLAIAPCGEGEVYHPLEASLLKAQHDEKSLAFYAEMNRWLEAVRSRPDA